MTPSRISKSPGQVQGAVTAAVAAPAVTTAWHDGAFAENTAGVVSRSDVVIKQPNLSSAQYLPLGNRTDPPPPLRPRRYRPERVAPAGDVPGAPGAAAEAASTPSR